MRKTVHQRVCLNSLYSKIKYAKYLDDLLLPARVPWKLYYPIMPNSHDAVTSSLFMSKSHTKTSFTCGSDILFQSKWAVLGLNK